MLVRQILSKQMSNYKTFLLSEEIIFLILKKIFLESKNVFNN